MKKLTIILLLVPFTIFAQQKKTTVVTKKQPVKKVVNKPIIQTGLDSMSYALGTRIAMNMAANHIDSLSYNAYIAGIKDVLNKRTLLFDDKTCNNIINEKVQELSKQKSKKEKAKSLQFLNTNKNREGVTVTASGLQYEVITMGTGIKPTIRDTVVCHYRGTLISGFEFDNSYTRGQPLSFPLNGVIKGWTEALQLMPQGSKWKLFIPSELGYGDNGAGNDIPGGAALIFEVELIDVKKAAN